MEKKIKKAVLLFFAILLIYGCSSAPPKNTRNVNFQITNSLNYISNYEYAFYLDKRFPDAVYRGYMLVSSNPFNSAVFVRNINANTGKEERFMFIVSDDENGYPAIVMNVQGQFYERETGQALPDFLNFTSLYLKTRNDYETQSSIDDEWDDFILIFNFDKTLPFFKFHDVKLKADGLSRYIFEHGGLLDPVSAQMFFEMSPVKQAETIY
jgi:hypothetical protein